MLRLRYAVSGEDRVTPLEADRLRIGRGVDNDLVLPDVSVSRNHAELRRESQGWTIFDLRSTNGVEVNGVPVESALLRAGDQLKIGAFELGVELSDPAPALPEPVIPLPHRSVLPSDSGNFGNATIIRPLADFAALYGLEGKRGEAKPAQPPVTSVPEADYAGRMIGFLTRLGRTLIEAESVDWVLERVLDLAFEAFRVDRGFILLSNAEGELVCELARVKERVEVRPEGPSPVSRTMLESVMRERVALVTYDAQSDQRLAGGESIRMQQIRSAMCAPLWSSDRIIGVIQVDSPFQVGAFGERDLDVLTTLANYVAIAVERIRYERQAEFEREVRSRLERYHSPAVIEEVMRRGGEARPLQLAHATVLFADLVGFTAFAENSMPEAVAASLDAFLGLSIEAIFRAGGTLDKFIGDCVMAFFGAPVAQADHAERAVRAAIEIQQGLNAWAQAEEEQGRRGFQARVALNSGPVVVGDIGSARRVDYTVLGNTVNVAARLEAFAANPGDVVIGPETHRLLNGVYATEELGELTLKGLKQAIMAYRVVM